MSIISTRLNAVGDIKILLNLPTKKLFDLSTMIFEIFKDSAEKGLLEQDFAQLSGG
jgi:hypothetical protein